MSRGEPFSTFKDEVKWLRESYMDHGMASNLYPPNAPSIVEVREDHSGPAVMYEYWYEGDDSGRQRYVRLHDIANTLSGDILRVRENLPADFDYVEIEGQIIRKVEDVPQIPDEILPDDEDCSATLELLPMITTESIKHFTKKPKYNSEIHNHIKLQKGTGGLSPKYVAPLLGRSNNNELVFSKMEESIRILASAQLHDLVVYKCWILDLINGLRQIHSHGIIHKDLRISNFLFTPRADKQMKNELNKAFESDAEWTEKSDIYDIAGYIRGIIYANNPINPVVGSEWRVPKALHKICSLCTNSDPVKRPTLDELQRLVEAIKAE